MAMRTAQRRRRILHRTAPLIALSAAAFVAGALVASRATDPEEALVERFAAAWGRGDYAAMHRELTEPDRARVPLARVRAGVPGGRAGSRPPPA